MSYWLAETFKLYHFKPVFPKLHNMTYQENPKQINQI